MSVINVSVSGGTGSTTTATTGNTVDVVVGNLSVGTLPALQIAAGTGITIATSNGVSTISANLSIPSNLSDLTNVQGTPTTGQVLAWNGTAWAPADDQTGGASDVANLADLSDVSTVSPGSGQALTWDGTAWAAANVPVGTTINGLSGIVTLVAGDNINVSVDGQNITIDTIGQSSISNLTDLVDVNATMSPTSGQALVWDGAAWTADSVTALVPSGTTLDLGTGKILYSNVYATLNDLPAAADYHGMFAHVHNYDGLGAGAAFYAHAGNWVRMADSDDIPASLVSSMNGLTGAVSVAGGSGISISQSSNQLTISSTASSSTINGQTGPVSLVGGNRIDISTSGGTITAAANLSGYLSWSTAPQNSSDSGSAGEVAYDGQYFYLHNGTQWNRVLLSSFGSAGGGGNVTTYRILTEGGDTLLAEGGDYINHDGTGAGNGTGGTGGTGNIAQLGSDIDGEAAGDYSGYSVAISDDGSRLAVGAYRNDGTGSNAGHVRVFDWSGSAWVQVGPDIDGEAAEDYSGYAVSLSGDGTRVAIGAYVNDGTGTNAGHVRVFDWSGSVWVQLGSDIDAEAAFDFFGSAVSLSDDGSRLAVGAAGNDGTGTNAGHVRVFDWSGSAWVQVGSDIDGEAAGDSFGTVSLSDDGSRLAVGAANNDGNSISNAGHVRVFDWSGSAWVQVGSDINGEAAEDYSGNAISLSGDGTRVAIGAYTNDGTGGDAGHVRVFDWSGSAWVQVGSDIDAEAADDRLGWSVSLSDDGSRLAVGAPQNDGTGTNAGHTRLYDWSGSAWVQVGSDIDGEAAGDYSGSSVAMSGDGSRLAVGAYGNDGAGADAGHVRVFEIT